MEKKAENVVGIYHNRDLDGFCSGAIIRLKYPEARMIGYDYGQDLEIESLKDKDIIMADVSMPMEDMLKISAIAKSFLWIDHHKSAIEDFKAIQDIHNIESVLEIGTAACELTWRTLFSSRNTPNTVKILGDYDVWRNEDQHIWNTRTLPFQYGMRLRCNSLDSFPMHMLDFFQFGSEQKLLESGRTILAYQKQTNETLIKRAGFEVYFLDKYKAVCVNACGVNSTVFDSNYDEEKHDVMIPFFYDGESYNLSFYTTKDSVDCSQIAKMFGGGGHERASGCKMSKEQFHNLFLANRKDLK
jgi:oligoribonuclease NrnB/cAMP/cGMP phosphodiesterase (DHH superfamily)